MSDFRVLFFDIEFAGVRALYADQGFVTCFGYKWLGEERPHCKTIVQYPGKNCQDDTELLKEALKIIERADILVAHFGAGCDRPYLESRLLRAKLKPLPPTRLVDTCLIARHRLKLSSNRLDSLARFLNVKTRKMEKGDGWPNWWMGAVRGDKESIRKMADYCKIDVQCLEEIYLAMRHIIPQKHLLHQGIGQEKRYVCCACGGAVNYHGRFFSEKKMWRRFQCIECGKWGREEKPIARTFSGYQPVK